MESALKCASRWQSVFKFIFYFCASNSSAPSNVTGDFFATFSRNADLNNTLTKCHQAHVSSLARLASRKDKQSGRHLSSARFSDRRLDANSPRRATMIYVERAKRPPRCAPINRRASRRRRRRGRLCRARLGLKPARSEASSQCSLKSSAQSALCRQAPTFG